MLKYWRIWILIVCILGATLAIGFKVYPYGRQGVEIVYVSDFSPAKGVLEQGMLISSINGNEIKNIDDWFRYATNASGNVTLIVNKNTYRFYVNDTLGLNVINLDRTNLDLGLDLKGGTRIILKPKDENVSEETLEQVIGTLQTRANLFGLKEMNFFPVKGSDTFYVQVEAAGVGSDVVDNLLSTQGNFEARILKPVSLTDKILQLGSKKYDVTVNDDSIEIEGKPLRINDTFILDDIEMEYVNKTTEKLWFSAKVYDGDDVELVYTDPQRSGIMPRGSFFEFYFAVLISEDGAKRFADITTGIPKRLDINTGEEYLDSKIILYLDGEVVSDLNIGASLGGNIVQTPQIQGSREERSGAVEEKLRLQTILRSGALPTELEKASVDIISPTLGTGFFSSAIYAVLFAGIAVFIIVFVRYRNIKIALPIAFIGLSEALIILGIASLNDVIIWSVVLLVNMLIVIFAWLRKYELDIYAWIGALLIPILGMVSWTIDLAAIGGIIAAIGTGVDHQVIIADETLRKKFGLKEIFTLKDKIKRAFFIIFGAAATTIIAMIPLMLLGIGMVRGFAITTIIGILVGVLITRPAYASIIERLIKD